MNIKLIIHYMIENKTLTNDYINYAKPLIMGELQPIYKDGLPVHLIRK